MLNNYRNHVPQNILPNLVLLWLVSNASNSKIIQYGLAKMHRLNVCCPHPFTHFLNQYFVKHNANYLTLQSTLLWVISIKAVKSSAVKALMFKWVYSFIFKLVLQCSTAQLRVFKEISVLLILRYLPSLLKFVYWTWYKYPLQKANSISLSLTWGKLTAFHHDWQEFSYKSKKAAPFSYT